VKEISYLPAASYDEWLCTSFWWSPGIGTINPDFSRERTTELFNQGLQFIRQA
jgi:hypothetical protein